MQNFILSVSVRVDSRDTGTIETMGELMTSMAHDLRLRASLLGLYGEYGMRLKLVHQPEVGAARPLPTEVPVSDAPGDSGLASTLSVDTNPPDAN